MDAVLQWAGPVVGALKDISHLPVILGIIETESRGDPTAKGSVGEIGLMQLRPEFHAPGGDASKLWDPQTNIEIGVAFFESLYDRYGRDLMRAIAAYNTGPGNMPAGGAIPNLGYVSKVMTAASGYAGAYAVTLGVLQANWKLIVAGLSGLIFVWLLASRRGGS